MAHPQRLALLLVATSLACGQTHGRPDAERPHPDAGSDAGATDAGRDSGWDAGVEEAGLADASADAGDADVAPPCVGEYLPEGSPLDVSAMDPRRRHTIRTPLGWAWIDSRSGNFDLYEVTRDFGRLLGSHPVSAFPMRLDGDDLPLPLGGVAYGPYLQRADRWLILLGRPGFTGAFYAVLIDRAGTLLSSPWALWAPLPLESSASVISFGTSAAGFELLWLEDATRTPGCPIARLTVMHVGIDGAIGLEPAVEIDGWPQVIWRDGRWWLRSFRACPEAVETLAQIDSTGVLRGPYDVSGLPPDVGRRWQLPQEGPWLAFGSHPTDDATTQSVTVAFVDPMTGAALGEPREVWNRLPGRNLLDWWGHVLRIPDGTYAWRFSTMDPLNPFGGRDLFVRFDDTGAVLQTTVLGEFRRGLPIQHFSWEGDRFVTIWYANDGRAVADALVCR